MNDQMVLNNAGRVVADEWQNTPHLRPNVELDEFVVMPNHCHGIVVITETRRGVLQYAPTPETPRLRSPSQTIGAIIRGFKSAVTKRINQMRGTPGVSVWQRGFYEHIIRNENEFNRTREYTANNPLQWELDRENPNMQRHTGQSQEYPWT